MVDRDRNKIGEVVDIYLDNETGRPEWAVVRTGLFGLRSSFVPLAEAREVGDEQQAIGWSNRRIAEATRLSYLTVRSHMQNLLLKLGVNSQLEAVAFAVQHGVVAVDAATPAWEGRSA